MIPLAHAQGVDLSEQYAFGKLNSLGEGFGYLVPVGFTVAAAAVTFYLLIGAFKYLSSGGDKNAIAGARAMIIHSIIGYILLIFLFLILQFLPVVLGLGDSFQIIK